MKQKKVTLDHSQALAYGTPEWIAAQQAAHEQIQAMARDALIELEAFLNSDECRAREALRTELERLQLDPVISKDPVCVELLGAFRNCVTYRWGAKDAAGMVDILAPYFRSVEAQKAVTAKLENSAQQREKQLAYECWLEWQREPSRYKSKTKFAADMLRAWDSLGSQAVILRWIRTEWEKKDVT